MRSSTLVLVSTTANLAAAAPFSYPLANGFPNLNSTAMQQVFKLAGGTPPNTPTPSNLTQAATQTLQLIAANELFETAYFTELISNITNKVPGYEYADEYALQTLTAVVNQETVHALAANGVLANANQTTIQPCEYQFPVSDFDSAIALAETFTEVVLGVLPLAQATFAADANDEAGLIPVIGAIIAQEGEQTGYYRFLQKKVAAAAPVLTGGAPQFAYTAISQFFVPGSCPNIDVIGLTTLPALTVETMPKAENSTQLFSINGTVSASNASIAYLSGQNYPVTVPITNVNTEGGKTYFFAEFPYDAGFARGLTIGALVSGANMTFNSSADVAAATLAGPACVPKLM